MSTINGLLKFMKTSIILAGFIVCINATAATERTWSQIMPSEKLRPVYNQLLKMHEQMGKPMSKAQMQQMMTQMNKMSMDLQNVYKRTYQQMDPMLKKMAIMKNDMMQMKKKMMTMKMQMMTMYQQMMPLKKKMMMMRLMENKLMQMQLQMVQKMISPE